MKTTIKLTLIVFSFYICTNSGYGQIPTYILSAENFRPNGDYYTANEFTFDIVIRHSDTTMFEYAGGQYSIDFNTHVANGGALSFTFSSDTSDLPANLRPRNPHIVSGSNISQMVLDFNIFPAPGNGFLIPVDSGVAIAKLKFKTTAVTFQFEGGPLGGWYIINLQAEWNITQTKVCAFIDNVPAAISPYYSFIDNSGLNVNPVELSVFSSAVHEDNITLSWTTSSEINNYGFDIERKIINGQWARIGFVNGSGTTNEMKYYTFTDRGSTGKYRYRLRQIDYNGNYEYFDLANEVQVGLPQKFELSQNYPNPFNPSTRINYSIPFSEFVSLKVYDINGREVSALVKGEQSGGYYEISFDASDLPGGVYFYSFTAGSFTNARRMVLIK